MATTTSSRATEAPRITMQETMARAGRFVEAGAALHAISGDLARPSRRADDTTADERRPEHFDVIVIGGGQAGLSTGYHLARTGLRYVILDAHDRIGDAWRNRWDSLRLFTPARFCGLDGLPFPAPWSAFPTKDEMADYLHDYAAEFRLPIRTGTRVDAVRREGDRYIVDAGRSRFEAAHVVIAAASYQEPSAPAFASRFDSSIRQIHSANYRNPAQLKPGGVVLVGAGNSGAEIAMELAQTHTVWLSGRHPGEIPVRTHTAFATRVVCPVLFRLVFHRLLTVDTPLGRKARPNFIGHGALLIHVKSRDLAAAGVRRVSRVVGVVDGLPVYDEGGPLSVDNVIWCTGYRLGLDWVKLPIFDESGRPRQARGVVEGEPGLYVVGLPFQHSPSSAMIHGVGRDARRVVEALAARVSARGHR